MMRLYRRLQALTVAVFSLLLIGACLETSHAAQAPANPDASLMSLNEAMGNSLVQEVPVKLAFPESFQRFSNFPRFGVHLWTTPEAYSALEAGNELGDDTGVFQVWISTHIAYDLLERRFFCGPGCTEETVIEEFEASGATDLTSQQFDVNGVPVWIIEGTNAGELDFAPIRMAYVGTLISTNVVTVGYRAPPGDPQRGEIEWLAMKAALTAVDGQDTTAANEEGERRGRVDGDTFVAADERFRVPVPPLGPGARVDEHYEESFFGVTFTDDFGSLFGIEGASVDLLNLPEDLSRNERLETFAERLMEPAFRSVSAEATVEKMRELHEVMGGATLYRAVLPGASTLAISEDGGPLKRGDSYRAVIVFLHDDYFFQVSVQEPAVEGAVDWGDLGERAIAFAETIRMP